MLPNFPDFLDIKVNHIITLLLPHPLPVIIQQLSYQSTLYVALAVEIIAKFFQDNQTRKLQHTLLISDRTSVSTLHRAVATVHDPTVHPSTHPTPLQGRLGIHKQYTSSQPTAARQSIWEERPSLPIGHISPLPEFIGRSSPWQHKIPFCPPPLDKPSPSRVSFFLTISSIFFFCFLTLHSTSLHSKSGTDF